MGPRSGLRFREPRQPQAALFAHHAGNDFWRGGRCGHAFHRRRSAAKSDGLHRAARRSQHHCRGQGSAQFSGTAESAERFSGPDASRLSDYSAQRRRCSEWDAEEAFCTKQIPAQAAAGYSCRIRRRAQLPRNRPPPRYRRTLLRRVGQCRGGASLCSRRRG